LEAFLYLTKEKRKKKKKKRKEGERSKKKILENKDSSCSLVTQF